MAECKHLNAMRRTNRADYMCRECGFGTVDAEKLIGNLRARIAELESREALAIKELTEIARYMCRHLFPENNVFELCLIYLD